MSDIQRITPEGVVVVGPYSPVVKAGGTYYISGQIAMNPQTKEFVDGDIKTQTEFVMKNIELILKSLGLTFSNLVKTTIYLTNMPDFTIVNETYSKFFKEGEYPARATIQIAALPRGAKVEIEAIACD